MKKPVSLIIFFLLVIIAGIVIRYVLIDYYQPEHGAVLQLVMAQSFEEKGKFIMEFGPIFGENDLTPAPSDNFPPLYPILISLCLDVHNSDFQSLKIFSFILALITLVVILILTSHLFGLEKGLFCAAIWSIGGVFIDNSSKCLSENLQVIVLLIFLYLFVRSFQKPWLLLPSAIFLGFAYLTKGALSFVVTLVILVAGSILMIFRNKSLLLPMLVSLICFFLVIFPWGLRNYAHFSTFDTSPHVTSALYQAFTHPVEFVKGLALNFLPVASATIMLSLIFIKAVARINLREIDDGILAFFVYVGIIIALIYAASFYVAERSFIPLNSIRYSIVSVVPLLWLILKHVDIKESKERLRMLIAVSIFFLTGVGVTYQAITTDDKPLINESDIALAEYIETYTDIYEIHFSTTMNKNDFYYYRMKMKDIPIKQFSDKDQVRYYLISGSDAIPLNYEVLRALDSSGKLCAPEEAKRILLRNSVEKQR